MENLKEVLINVLGQKTYSLYKCVMVYNKDIEILKDLMGFYPFSRILNDEQKIIILETYIADEYSSDWDLSSIDKSIKDIKQRLRFENEPISNKYHVQPESYSNHSFCEKVYKKMSNIVLNKK